MSHQLLIVVWQELCTIHPVQIPFNAKVQFPSKPRVGQTLGHRIQLQRPGGVTQIHKCTSPIITACFSHLLFKNSEGRQ